MYIITIVCIILLWWRCDDIGFGSVCFLTECVHFTLRQSAAVSLYYYYRSLVQYSTKYTSERWPICFHFITLPNLHLATHQLSLWSNRFFFCINHVLELKVYDEHIFKPLSSSSCDLNIISALAFGVYRRFWVDCDDEDLYANRNKRLRWIQFNLFVLRITPLCEFLTTNLTTSLKVFLKTSLTMTSKINNLIFGITF